MTIIGFHGETQTNGQKKNFTFNDKNYVLGAIALLVSAIIGYLTIETVTDDGAQGEFVAGIHYVELNDPRRIRGDAIEVMEFFSYGCYFLSIALMTISTTGPRTTAIKFRSFDATHRIRSMAVTWGEHYYALERLDGP